MSILDVNVNDIFNAIGGGSPLSIIDSVLHPSYVIRNHGDSSVALEFSGMYSIQPSGTMSIVNAPVEKGKYQSINKVKKPGQVVCEVVISGLTGFSGSIPDIFDLTLTSQSSSLTTIKEMLDNTKLYDIDTPKGVFESYDLMDYSYRVTSKNGVTLLLVHLTFQEVMEQMEVVLSGQQDKNKPTSDAKSQSPVGVGSPQTKGGDKPATVDDLQSSWGNIRTALSGQPNPFPGKIVSGFRSSLETVNGTLFNTPTSTNQNAINLVNSIKGAIT